MFINILPTRSNLAGDKTFIQFIKELKKDILEAFENQEYQFDDLVDKLKVNREGNRNPIFNVAIDLQNFESQQGKPTRTENSGSKSASTHYENVESKFDLSIDAKEIDGRLFISLEYNSRLFKKSKIERWAAYFTEILLSLPDNIDIRLKDIKISHDLADPTADIGEIDFKL
jgi:non-ribosomal peptide synthetase component F